jgi:Tfp pilus assembly protein FimT
MTSVTGTLPVNKAPRGVTLVEMCLVSMILALLFVISWPAFNGTARKIQLEGTFDEISNTLSFARDAALGQGKCFGVEFDAVERSYRLSFLDDTGNTVVLNDSLHRQRSLPAGIDFKNLSTRQILFFPDGTCQDFELSIEDKHHNAYALKIEGSTGKATTTTTFMGS